MLLLIRFWPSRAEAQTFRGSPPPDGISLPSFVLHDALGGGAVRSRDLRGDVVLVTFLDTRCEEACPIIASQIARGLQLLEPDQRSTVTALAISVDPQADTPARVRAFLRERRADAIRYVSGSVAQLRPVWRAFHVLPAVDTGDADVHSADVRVFDRDGTWVSTLHTGVDLTPANLAHDVVEALR